MIKKQPPLAIVVPAYKARFLREALKSIVEQTDRNFRVYIGDDASPEAIGEIVHEFSNALPIVFRRFEKNLGRISLVQHWERCILMSHEPWIWLFSDDDVMEPGCVEKFFREQLATEGRHDLYRFNTASINGDGSALTENAPHPQNETGPDFLVSRLRGGRTSTAQELIFSRAAWEQAQGFPDFPLGWASDDAFIALLGADKTIRTIPGPRVRWRLSGHNISKDNSPATAAQKLQACREFVEWAANFLEAHPPANRQITNGTLAALLEDWFFLQLYYTKQLAGLKASLEIDALASSSWNRRRGYGFLKTMKLNCNLARQKVLTR